MDWVVERLWLHNWLLLGKLNVVVNALIQKPAFELREIFAQLSICNDGSLLAKLKIKPVLIYQMKEEQSVDAKLVVKGKLAQKCVNENFNIDEYNCLQFRNWICIPDNVELKKLILYEAHNSSFDMHLGGAKMYRDLRES